MLSKSKQCRHLQHFQHKRATDLTKYVKNGKNVFHGAARIKRMEEAGLNIEWYLHGTGDMNIPKSLSQDFTVERMTEYANIIDFTNMTPAQVKEMVKIYKPIVEKGEKILEASEQ